MRSADAGLFRSGENRRSTLHAFLASGVFRATLESAPKGETARPQKASDGDSRRFAVVQHSALYHHDRRVQAN
jgi:hypothetical protein